jgi:nucleoside-diphosphate-sugar epimerase
MARKQVLIAGASGLVGYAAIRCFGPDSDCDVIALSRRAPDGAHGARFLPLDLTDAAACEQLAARLPGVTHLVYAALYERPGLIAGWREREQIETNERMFRNLLDPLERHSKNLRHVTLLQGTKAYGVHVRPLSVPARENRSEMHEQPNFYWNQENHLRALQRGKHWTWSILRPVLIVGYSSGSAMNVIPALGVYAALRREAGLDLPFPGGGPRVAQAIDADLLARAIAWAGEAASARNEIFNITNGDYFRWQNLWPKVADVFEMPIREPQTISLTAHMADKAPVWRGMAEKYGLQPYPYEQLVAWPFADYVFGCDWDVMSDVTKSRRFGFQHVTDSEEMFVRLLRRFRAERIVP